MEITLQKKLPSGKSQRGASMVEYTILLATIAIIAITSVRSVGLRVRCLFEKVANEPPFSAPLSPACGGTSGGGGY